MRLPLSIILGKLIFHTTRTLKKGGGSAAPGLYALKIDPNLVEKLIRKVPKNIIITGTNGKTTTARLLAHFAESAGLKVIRNSTGSNLERGIASTLIANYQLPATRYQIPDIGIWELDEAAFNQVAPKINPDLIIFLNIYRDQLDRYGEIDSVLKKWQDTISKLSSETEFIINGDDQKLVEFSKKIKAKVSYFGIEGADKITGELSIQNPTKVKLDIKVKNIKNEGLSGSTFTLTTNSHLLTTKFSLPGLYHVYDFLAAFSAGIKLGLDINSMIKSLPSFIPAFGRVENIKLKNGHQGYIFLIKNPTGATQVLQTLASEIRESDRLLIALNDNLADGTDVSWIWDTQFEKCKVQSAKCKIICSGSRAEDLALRLKYAGVKANQIIVEPGLDTALETAQIGLNGRLFILPTYTALLTLQSIFANSGIIPTYWRDN